MAHFAELDENNMVLRVVVVADEHEADGVAWCHNLLGGRWVQTSYTASIRKNYAGVGYTYDESRDAFIPPSPYPSWVLDEERCNWIPPIEYPVGDSTRYQWDEQSISWKEEQGD